jgi:hypothetical protein
MSTVPDLFGDDDPIEPAVPTITPTVVESTAVATESQLARIIKDAKLEADSEKLVLSTFSPLVARVQDWASKIDAIIPVGREPSVSENKVIKETRISLMKIRTGADKERKRILENTKQFTNAMNSANKQLVELVTPLEEKLEAAEKYAERMENERREALKAARVAEVSSLSFVGDMSFYNFGEMPEEVYQSLYQTLKATNEASIAATKKAEEDRLAKEKADRDEREKVRLENEKLKADAAVREKEIAAERKRVADEKAAADAKAAKEKADADAIAKAERDRLAAENAKKLADERAKAKADADAAAEVARKAKEAADLIAKTEREAREKAEAEVAKVKAAEAKKLADEAAAAKKAAKAPEKEKVARFAKWIRDSKVPELSSPEGVALQTLMTQQRDKFATWLEKEGEKL